MTRLACDSIGVAANRLAELHPNLSKRRTQRVQIGGEVIKADLGSVTAAASGIKTIPNDFRMSITDSAAKGAYRPNVPRGTFWPRANSIQAEPAPSSVFRSCRSKSPMRSTVTSAGG